MFRLEKIRYTVKLFTDTAHSYEAYFSKKKEALKCGEYNSNIHPNSIVQVFKKRNGKLIKEWR